MQEKLNAEARRVEELAAALSLERDEAEVQRKQAIEAAKRVQPRHKYSHLNALKYGAMPQDCCWHMHGVHVMWPALPAACMLPVAHPCSKAGWVMMRMKARAMQL